MKKLTNYLALTVLFIASITNTYATHVMGGEITYKNVGINKLEVTVSVYRDCNGIALSNSPVNFRTDSGNFAITLPLVQVKDITGVDKNCPAKTRCDSSGSYSYGVEEYIYRGIADISNLKGCNFIISWTQCCRNSNITTGAANANYYMETSYNRCLTPSNSSPSFISYPVVFLGVGQDLSVSHTAIDSIDNDEITYELTEPLSARGSKIAYMNPWSAERPLTFSGFPNTGFVFDSLTSNMSFRPTQNNQSTVVSIKVKEWRKINGVRTKISETHRDVQLIFVNVPNNKAPKIGVNNVNSVITACQPDTVYFNIPVEDADVSDSVYADITHNFNNLTVTKTYTAGNKLNLYVCIALDSTELISSTKFLKISAVDNHCPQSAKVERAYALRVDSAAAISVFKPQAVCDNDSPVVLQSIPNYAMWSGAGVSGSTFSPTVAGNGKHFIVYSFTDSITKCSIKDSFEVTVLKHPKASFIINKNTGLLTDTFKFTNTTIADSVPPLQSLWNMGQPSSVTNQQSTKNARHVYNDSGKFVVMLRVSNGICNADSITDTIVVSLPLSVFSTNKAEIKLYPNPVKDRLTIEGENDLVSITLVDVLGKRYTMDNFTQSTKTELNISYLPKGTYIIEAKDKQGNIFSSKLLIVK